MRQLAAYSVAHEAPAHRPLRFTSTGNSTVGVSKENDIDTNLFYRISGGDWQEYTSSSTEVSLADGEWVEFENRKDVPRDTDGPLFRFDMAGSLAGSGSVQSLMNYADYCTKSCYKYMFSECESLTHAPELPATTLASECYTEMFFYCTTLTTAPELPATTLSSYCYAGMFKNCTSLTAAPELPATVLASGCYSSMFSGCTALTAAPELPATTLAEECYYSMFQNCPNITQLTTHQTSFVETGEWLSGVAATGTFRCPRALGTNETIERGADACPTGWTVVNID